MLNPTLNVLDGDSSEEDEAITSISLQIPAISSSPIQESGVDEETKSFRPVLLQLPDNDEDDEDEDAPLPITIQSTDDVLESAESSAIIQSEECAEALQAVESDCWDINSWILFMDEADAGRGGAISVPDAYSRFLEKFPCAAKQWKALAEYHILRQEYSHAEEVFKKCLSRCRNVELWQSYIQMIQLKSPLEGSQRTIEAAFEKALENVGMSISSNPLWTAYIDFIRNWPDSDAGRKLAALRKLYQRAVCVPMDESDIFWKEYETLEKMAGEHLAEKVLPEYSEKHMHANAIFKERRRVGSKIEFDRLAVPPTNSMQELQQLSAWNKWIRYEITNPDNLGVEQHNSMMKFIFGQCLCCLLHHTEVWMTYAKFRQTTDGIVDARNIYMEAIEIIPDVVSLRLALAELEESNGNDESSKIVLKIAYERIPCAFTFSALQRFIRRRDGVTAARKLFSDTLAIRKNPTKEALGLEFSMAHAHLELNVNCSPLIALKVLNVARASSPSAAYDVRFVCMLCHVLTIIGDLKQIRWIFQTILSEPAVISPPVVLVPGAPNLITSGLSEITSSFGEKSFKSIRSLSGTGSEKGSLKDQLVLWDEYLKAETVLGLSSVSRLDDLRKSRDKAKLQYEDSERARQIAAAGGVVGTEIVALGKIRGLFDCSYELGERYDQLGTFSLPIADSSLQQRSKGKFFLEEVAKQEAERMAALREAGQRRWKRDRDGDDGPGHFSGVPPVLREFLPRLPAHTGPIPDVEGFIRQLRAVVLPPRPSDDSDFTSSSLKRNRDDMTTAVVSTDWMQTGVLSEMKDDDDNDDDDDGTADVGIRDDIFRQRQRQRVAIS